VAPTSSVSAHGFLLDQGLSQQAARRTACSLEDHGQRRSSVVLESQVGSPLRQGRVARKSRMAPSLALALYPVRAVHAGSGRGDPIALGSATPGDFLGSTDREPALCGHLPGLPLSGVLKERSPGIEPAGYEASVRARSRGSPARDKAARQVRAIQAGTRTVSPASGSSVQAGTELQGGYVVPPCGARCVRRGVGLGSRLR
jgi:hypothetical protein